MTEIVRIEHVLKVQHLLHYLLLTINKREGKFIRYYWYDFGPRSSTIVLYFMHKSKCIFNISSIREVMIKNM